MFEAYFLIMCLLYSLKPVSSFPVQFIGCNVLANHLMLPSSYIVVKQQRDQCVCARCTSWLAPTFHHVGFRRTDLHVRARSVFRSRICPQGVDNSPEELSSHVISSTHTYPAFPPPTSVGMAIEMI